MFATTMVRGRRGATRSARRLRRARKAATDLIGLLRNRAPGRARPPGTPRGPPTGFGLDTPVSFWESRKHESNVFADSRHSHPWWFYIVSKFESGHSTAGWRLSGRQYGRGASRP